MKKLSIALLAALASISLGAYAAGEKTDTSKGATGTDQPSSMGKTWTKDEATKAGITEDQFKAADTNGDGKLDQQEMSAAGLKPAKK
jgi:osmotically-inducible protein OsmY